MRSWPSAATEKIVQCSSEGVSKLKRSLGWSKSVKSKRIRAAFSKRVSDPNTDDVPAENMGSLLDEGLGDHAEAPVDAVVDLDEEGTCWNKAFRSVRASKEDIIRNVEEELRREGCGVWKEGGEHFDAPGGIAAWNRESIFSTRLSILEREIVE